MRKPLFIMICLMLLALFAPLQAQAAECGNATKLMQIKRYGFVPDLQYACSADSVIVYNDTGNYVTFNYKDYLGRTLTVSNLRNRSWVTLTAATPIYNVRTYGRYGYYLLPAEIRAGWAPDSY